MDVLTDVLDSLRFQGTLYFSTELGRSWGIRVPAFESVARFHLVLRGSCWVEVTGSAERVTGSSEPVRLDAGELALIPHGAEHVLSDRPSQPARSVDEVVEAADFDGTGALVYGEEDEGGPTRMVCGHLAFDPAFQHPVLEQLPPVLVVPWEGGVQGTPLEDLMGFIGREVREARPGHEAVARRLSEVIFVQAVRIWTEQRGDELGLVSALSDAGLSSALQAIHSEPGHSWTLEELARRSHMSRTTFAERFRDTVGMTPHQYLTGWRMQLARRLLAESARSIARIASEVGYDSSAAFSRAFKREVGSPPARYRRRQAEERGAAAPRR